MKYPQWVGFSRQRTLQFTHGVAGSIDDELARVTKVHDNYNVSGYAHATYAYAGSGRRIQTEYGSNGTTFAAKQSFALSGQPGYPLLDRFGRVADLHFTDASNSATLHRARYGYDAADSRLFARITQHQTGSTPHDNDRSWLYGYDTLNRLTSASLGALDTTNTAITTTNPRLIQWNLDTLGNWNGGDIQTGGGLAGKTVSYDTSIPPNGTYDDPTTYTHATDTRNELDSLTVQTPSGPTTAPFYYDANGNLVNDGPDGFFYQYDAHNRLVQVNKRGSLQFNADGTILSGDPGAWVAHYTYDGVGRLIRKQVPWNYVRTALRAEAYYYDGVRRIQEVFTDPKPGTFPEKVHQGDPPPNPVYITATRGEFIWAPGGGAPGYVDELICQITPLNAPQYVLQDANYNAVALVALAGTVLSQFTYDPYGEPIIAEQGINGTTSQVMDLRVGHQGLFLDRLNLLGNGALDESGATGSNWTIAAPTGGLGNRALYQNRNRSYSPSLGRFLQRDPNSTGQRMLLAGASHGTPTSAPCLDCDAAALYGDGMNLYHYVASAPTNMTDPSGLFFGMAFQMASMGADAWASAEGALEGARQGIMTWFGLYETIRNYGAFQNADVEWASDLSLADDAYTRSAEFSSGRGSWADQFESQSQCGGGPAMAAGLYNTDRTTYQEARNAWGRVRQKMWLMEHDYALETGRGGWTKTQLSRMSMGLAPKGYIIHHNIPLSHGGTNDVSNLTIMKRSDHLKNFKPLHRVGCSPKPSVPGRRHQRGRPIHLPGRLR